MNAIMDRFNEKQKSLMVIAIITTITVINRNRNSNCNSNENVLKEKNFTRKQQETLLKLNHRKTSYLHRRS